MEKHENLLNLVMEFNKFVRFAVVCNQNGEVLWHSEREGLKKLVPYTETKQTLSRAISSWKENSGTSKFAGPGLYAITSYEKIKRISIPLDKGNMLFVSMANDPLKKSKTKSYGHLAEMGDILSIVDFVKSQK